MARTTTVAIGSADANMIPLRPIEYLRSTRGNTPPTELINPYTGRPFLAAAGQYFMNGDMVHLLAGTVNEVAEAATVPIAGFVIGGGSADGTTVVPTSQEVRIMPVRTGDVYAMNFYAATPSTSTNPDDITALCGALLNITTASVTNWNFQTGAIGTDTTLTGLAYWLATTQTAGRVRLLGVHKTLDMTASSWLVRVEVEFVPVVVTWTHATNVAASIIGPNLQFDM
jgi:hypothetical protein